LKDCLVITLTLERKPIRIGTRGSLLARTQTDWVTTRLQTLHPDLEFETVVIETTGDKKAGVPYAAVGAKGMFVKEIEQALTENHIDVGVHSLKDMPGELPAGLAVSCVPVREDALDAFISKRAGSLAELPSGCRVGTSSARRRAQISAYRRDLNIVELRGNLDTRLRKLEDGDYDAIILACAGLNRLGLQHIMTERIPVHVCLPAVGQGALAIETRSDDRDTSVLLTKLNDADSFDCITAERALLKSLGGGCSVPIAAHAELINERIHIAALVSSLDGSTIIRASASGPRSRADQVGIESANRLLAQNAEAILHGEN
jgi:hydroxymethylbilane synthase